VSNNNLEILSPAGSSDILVCAINNGADAVYLGGHSFSARKNAANFSDDELRFAVKYAHLYGKKVYVTVNTLIYDNELEEAFAFIQFLYNIGVDALIIQDLGILRLVKKHFPDFEIHASTQMTIHNKQGAQLAKEMGFSRVVLSRELTLGEIKDISDSVDIELEVFVHGALCMCYSGQCLMSSFIGARSGNRGDCAQPCRLPYTLTDKDGTVIGEKGKYLLSLKDLCLVDELKFLADAGVKSLKIEGRMKSAQYVSLVTHMYNKYRNGGNVSKKDMDLLSNIFSRSGFTKGYAVGDYGRHMLNYNTNNDKVYDNISRDVHAFADELKTRTMEPVPFDAKATLKIDEPMVLEVVCGQVGVTVKTDAKVEKAHNVPISAERVKEQISKCGATPFSLCDIEIDLDEGAIIPVKEINNLRRNALELLEQKIAETYERKSQAHYTSVGKKNKSFDVITKNAEVKTKEQAIAAANAGFDKILVPYSLYVSESDFFENADFEVAVVLPAVVRDNKPIDTEKINCELYASNFYQLSLANKHHVSANHNINVFNTFALELLEQMGVDTVCLSPELNAKAISAIGDFAKKELIVYGRIPLMTVQNCLVKSARGKCLCNEGCYVLNDRKGAQFPVFTDKHSCTNTIYNSAPVYMADKMDKIAMHGVSSWRFVFTTETPDQIEKIYKNYMTGAPTESDFTRGHYFRGV